MVKWLNIIVLFGFCINCIPYTQYHKYPQSIRVAILTGLDSVTVSGIKDNQYFEDYKIKITDSLPIYFKPKEGKVVINGRPYYGYMEIKRINDKIWVINSLNIEDYLKGVVPCEIGRIKRDLLEAAKAQAIAARTYTYAHLNKYGSLGFDLYATLKDQVYEGIDVEDPLINEAIAKTRGLILTYKGIPIEAKYHSTCGGHTADFNDAWKGSPILYLKSVECGFCKGSPHYEWHRAMTRREFFKNLRKNLLQIGIQIPDTGLIRQIRVKRNPESKRVIEVKVVTDEGEYIIPNYNIRTVFGSNEDPDRLLKSNNFRLLLQGDSVVIEGKGFGHGVGMCQFGAMGMAKKGKTYRDILRHYYPGTRITKVYF